MTEHQAEIWVEMQIDRLDMKYTLGRLTEEEYRLEVQKISKEAEKLLKNE
jgi:hypothetical protein